MSEIVKSHKADDISYAAQVTLRDRFAMAALTGLLASGEYTMQDSSEYCWAAADHALLMRSADTIDMRVHRDEPLNFMEGRDDAKVT